MLTTVKYSEAAGTSNIEWDAVILSSIPLHYGRVAQRLERLPTVPETAVRDPPGTIGWKLAHCPPSSKWVPGGNTGGDKGGEERNWPPYLTMPMAQDKYPL